MDLPRLQLFEFNDLPGAPAPVRDTVVESLSHTLEWGRILQNLVAPFQTFLSLAGTREILDLGAGGGAPARILASEMARIGARPPRFVLTDLHPRVDVWTRTRDRHPGVIDFEPSPVDATNIPPGLAEGRARILINVMHHFSPALASAILADAVRGSRGIFIAESFERSPVQFGNLLPAGLPALLLNPILSPRDRLAKACLTWFSPAAVAISLWDGIVSTLRIHSEADLRAMVAPFGGGWTWEYGTFSYFPRGTGTYFYGVPRG